MKILVNRNHPIPIRQQIRGAIEHEISFGRLPVGAALPSVRVLADQVGVAPMTISTIYAELKADGVIEGRGGAGTFVADSRLSAAGRMGEAAGIRSQIDRLIDQATELGLQAADLVALVNARIIHRLNAAGRARIVMVGLFDDATASYAERLAAQVGARAQVESVTIAALRADTDALAQVRGADLLVTFSNLHPELETLTQRADIISLRFIPSETTRMALAALDPMARVAVVSRFVEFLPILTLGVRRFAAHVQTFAVINMDDPDLQSVLADCDVIVLATGAEDAGRLARPDMLKIEYRHIPDPGDIDRLVMPLLTPAQPHAEQNTKEAS
ncbi:MAG: GntR family transcriptional regulator [Pseudorhodobacter sp. PARRP1]|nr:MAG: GntR family transcriptional regulator [Pseudorhodobacter sp. PARRP1]